MDDASWSGRSRGRTGGTSPRPATCPRSGSPTARAAHGASASPAARRRCRSRAARRWGPRGTSSWSSGSARRWPRRRGPRAPRCCSGPPSTCSARRSAVATSSASPRTRTSPRGSPAPTCGACRAAGWRPASSTWWPTTRSTTASRSPSELDERTLREVSLLPFEHLLRGGAWSTMAAYNRLHGTHCSANERLLTTILRDEWGWDGVVISDWFAVHTHRRARQRRPRPRDAGPGAALGSEAGGGHRRAARCTRGRDRGQARAAGAPGPSHRRRRGSARGRGGRRGTGDGRRSLARRRRPRSCCCATRGCCRSPPRSGAWRCVGPNARSRGDPGRRQRPGHAHRRRHDRRRPARAAGRPARRRAGHRRQPRHAGDAGRRPPARRRHRWASTWRSSAATARCAAALRPRDFRILFLDDPGRRTRSARAGRRGRPRRSRRASPGPHRFKVKTNGEATLTVDGAAAGDEVDARGGSSPSRSSSWRAATTRRCAWPPSSAARRRWPPDAFEQAVAAARAADVAIVVVGLDNDWETEGRDRTSLDLPGRQVELIEAVAAVQPRTVVAVVAGSPVDLSWAAVGAGPAVVLAARARRGAGPSPTCSSATRTPAAACRARMPARLEDTPAFLDTPPDPGVLRYQEGVFAGHRWYDAAAHRAGVPVRLRAQLHDRAPSARRGWRRRPSSPGAAVEVDVEVTNTGDRAGSEVVQLYVGDPDASVRRPATGAARRSPRCTSRPARPATCGCASTCATWPSGTR